MNRAEWAVITKWSDVKIAKPLFFPFSSLSSLSSLPKADWNESASTSTCYRLPASYDGYCVMRRGAATTNWHSLRLSFVKSCLDLHTNGKLPQQNSSSSSSSDLLISTIYAAAKHPITHYKHCLPYRPTPPFFCSFFLTLHIILQPPIPAL